MAIHYDAAAGRFRDGRGAFVSDARAQRSSVARAEYAKAHTPARPAPPLRAPAKPAPPPRAPAKPAPARIHYDAKAGRFRTSSGAFVSRARAMRSSVARAELAAATAPPTRRRSRSAPPPTPAEFTPPWLIEGFIREYPAPGEWFDEGRGASAGWPGRTRRDQDAGSVWEWLGDWGQFEDSETGSDYGNRGDHQ